MVDFRDFKYLKVNVGKIENSTLYARRDKGKLVFKGKSLLVYVFHHTREFFTRMVRSPSLIKDSKLDLCSLLVAIQHRGFFLTGNIY